MQTVSQYQTAFGIGVDNLDRLARHSNWASPGFCALPDGLLRSRTDDADYFRVRLKGAMARMAPVMDAPPAMSYFIFSMPSAG